MRVCPSAWWWKDVLLQIKLVCVVVFYGLSDNIILNPFYKHFPLAKAGTLKIVCVNEVHVHVRFVLTRVNLHITELQLRHLWQNISVVSVLATSISQRAKLVKWRTSRRGRLAKCRCRRFSDIFSFSQTTRTGQIWDKNIRKTNCFWIEFTIGWSWRWHS